MKQRKLYIQIIDNLSEKDVYCGSIITDKSCKECCELYANAQYTVKVADETDGTDGIVCYMIGDKYMIAPLHNTVYVSYYKWLWRLVHIGMYDHARDAFHIELGKLLMLLQRTKKLFDIENEEERIKQLVNDWEYRYYKEIK